MKIILAFFIMTLISLTALAADTGKIAKLSFASGVAQTVRPGTVQFSIAGGFSENNCDNNLAAVSADDAHLISLLLSAQAQGKDITVFLDSNNKYYSNRCLVSYLEIR